MRCNELEKSEKNVLLGEFEHKLDGEYSSESQQADSDEDTAEYLKSRSLYHKKGFNAWAGRRDIPKRGFNAWAGKRSTFFLPPKDLLHMLRERRRPWGGAPVASD